MDNCYNFSPHCDCCAIKILSGPYSKRTFRHVVRANSCPHGQGPFSSLGPAPCGVTTSSRGPETPRNKTTTEVMKFICVEKLIITKLQLQKKWKRYRV